MARFIELQKFVLKDRTEPIRIVVEKIVAIEAYRRGGQVPVGSKVILEGGESVRVAEAPETVERLMKVK